MKKSIKLVSCTTAAAMIISLLPMNVNAQQDKAKVRINVENNVYSTEDGAPWAGTLTDEWTEVDADLTAGQILEKIMTEKSYQLDIQQSQWGSYLNGVNGLDSGAAGGWSGWMISFNDSFESGTLDTSGFSDGDEISVVYSKDGGSDIGYHWDSTNTALGELSVENGTLSPEFKADVFDYQLDLPEGTSSVKLNVSPADKKFMHEISSGDEVYKRSQDIPVSDGNVIKVRVYGSSQEIAETVYSLNVKIKTSEENKPDNSGQTTSPEEKDNTQETNNDKENPGAQEMTDGLTERFTADSSIAAAGNEWVIATLARLGKLDNNTRNNYLDSLKAYLSENEPSKATDNARTAIALTALGEDPADFGGKNLLSALSSKDYVNKQGVNGVVYSLIAFDTKKYDIPKAEDNSDQTTRDWMIGEILSAQLPDGGWTFFGDVYDPDMTAMALQALAPYKDNKKAAEAVKKAVELLSSVQNDDGSYTSFGTANADSTAQVIMALSLLGIDPSSDERFIKNGCSALDGLAGFYIADEKGFSHESGGSYNGYTSVQAYYALCSYLRMKENKTSFYDMSDVNVALQENNNTAENNDDKKNNESKQEESRPERGQQSLPTGDSGLDIIFAAVMLITSAAAILLINKKHA